MTNTVLSLLMIPECLFFSWFLIISKNIKSKRIKFLLTFSVLYILSRLIIGNKIYFHMSILCIAFASMKIFYKEKVQPSDFFSIIWAMWAILIFQLFSYSIFSVLLRLNDFIANPLSFSVCYISIYSLLYILRNKIRKMEIKIQSKWNKGLMIRHTVLILTNLLIFSFLLLILYGKQLF